MAEILSQTAQDGPNIFITGATGYVGGETLYQITREPALQKAAITCLVRDEQKARNLEQQYPGVKAVIGDLDDTDAIKRAASNSDIVLHLASFRHLQSAQAIVQGLKDRVSAHPDKKVYWIQMSGATLLANDEIKQSRFGEYSDQVWNGLRDAEEIRSTIRKNTGREVENFALSSMAKDLNVAMIIGPLIYGDGNGPGNKRSIQAPDMARYVLSKGQGFRLNAGLSRWSTIHVGDTGSLMAKLVASTTLSNDESSVSGLWNESGLYLPETGIVDFTELSNEMAQQAYKQGLIEQPGDEKSIDATEADKITSHGSVLLGTNAVLDFSQAQNVPGWKAQNPSLSETLSGLVKAEAAAIAGRSS